jgi:hypothetical protein
LSARTSLLSSSRASKYYALQMTICAQMFSE